MTSSTDDIALGAYFHRYMEAFPQKQTVDPPTARDLGQWLAVQGCAGVVVAEVERRLTTLLGGHSQVHWDPEADRLGVRVTLASGTHVVGVADVLERWHSVSKRERVPHPLARLMESWCARPPVKSPESGNYGVVPAPVLDGQTQQGKLFDLSMPRCKMAPVESGYLPGLAPPRMVASAPILAIFDALGMSPIVRAGRNGESVDRRLLLELLMCVPMSDRPLTRVALKVRTLRDWVWPHGWERRRDWPRLRAAIQSLNACWLPWEGPVDGRRERWRYAPVLVAWVPDDPDLDTTILFEIRLPPKTGQGPLVDRGQLRLYGTQSAPAWRCYLSIAHHWNSHLSRNGKPIGPTRPIVKRGPGGVILDKDDRPVMKGGVGVTDWSDSRAVRTGEVEENPAARRYGGLRVFTPEELLSWCYPGVEVKGSQRREYRHRAVGVVQSMHEDGAVKLEEGTTREGVAGWKIFRPDSLQNVS